MKSSLRLRLSVAMAISLFLLRFAQAAPPAALTLEHVVQIAREQRQEITATQARVAAASERPAIVSALEDPMISPAIDHYPFDRMQASSSMETPAPSDEEEDMGETPVTTEDSNSRRYDWSISVEQKFPLSRVLTHRRHAAEADLMKTAAEAEAKVLDVELEAISAFYMLQEKRRMAVITTEQIGLAQQLLNAAATRYSAGQGDSSEVLRVEVEVARLESRLRAFQAEIRAATRMLNAGMGRAPDTPIPALSGPTLDQPLPAVADVTASALSQRPELKVGAAEINRANADKKAMQSMYAPMGMVRAGYASTMAEGKGAMLMLGISIPIWRDKLRAGVAESRAMQQMAQADLEAMKRMVESEALSAHDQLDAAQSQYLALRDNVLPRAQRLISPALSAYASGRGNLPAVIEATQALWDVQQEAVMAEAALGIAWARLNRMTGASKDTTP